MVGYWAVAAGPPSPGGFGEAGPTESVRVRRDVR